MDFFKFVFYSIIACYDDALKILQTPLALLTIAKIIVFIFYIFLALLCMVFCLILLGFILQGVSYLEEKYPKFFKTQDHVIPEDVYSKFAEFISNIEEEVIRKNLK